jgi:hypothetical protein
MRLFLIYVISHAAILIVSLILAHKTKFREATQRVHTAIQHEQAQMLRL